jgi:tetratricopeptide (TPR) repeat protein
LQRSDSLDNCAALTLTLAQKIGQTNMIRKSTKIFIVLLLMLAPAFAQTPDKVTPLLDQGEALIHAGQLVQAQEFFEKALLRFPGNPDLLFNLGMALFLQQDWPKAIENYKKSLLAKPNQVNPLYYMAQAYYRNSDLRLARETMARAAALAPDNPDVCQKYGEYLADTKVAREKGLKWLQKARTLDPSLERIDFDIGLTYLNLKDMQGAAVSLQAALKKDPANGEAAFLLAESRSALGDWGKARDSFNYALSHGYSSGPAYYGLGTALVLLGRYEAALAPLQRALDLQPSLIDAHVQLGKAYRQLGRLEDARRETKLYEEMKARAPDEVTPLLAQGEGLARAGQLVQAQAFFEKALLRFPDNPDLSFDLGMVFLLQQNWPKAIENYQKSLLVKPNRVDPLYYMAQAYYQSSELDLALETIARAAKLAPDNPDVCQEYGEYLAERMDRSTEGLKWLEKARALNPDLGRIDFDIGMAQYNLNDLRGAVASLQDALKKDSANGEAAFLLGESWSGLGDWEKARDSYNYALSHGYSSGPAYCGLGTAQVQLGSYKAALAPLKKALELDPSFNKAHFLLSKAYRQLGRLEEAQSEEKLFETLDQSKSNTATYTEFDSTQTPVWAHVKALLQENKEQEALDYVAKPPSQTHNNAQSLNPYYLLGVVYHTMGRMDDARRVLEIARTQAPTNAEIPAYLGVVQMSTGEVDQAEKSCNSALALDPADEQALLVLAHIRYKQQRWEDVIAYLERSHTVNPGALYMLCDAYYRVGKTNQAIATAEAIRSLAANNKSLLDDLDQLVKLHQADQPASAPK